MNVSLILSLLILQVENKQAEYDLLKKLQQLHEEKQKTERDVLKMKEKLDTKKKEVHLFILILVYLLKCLIISTV